MINKILQVFIPVILMLSLVLIPGSPVAAASTAPTVYSQSPTRGSTGVSVSIQPTINFSKTMDGDTINATNVQLMNGGTVVPAAVVLSGTKKAVITPDAPLNYTTAYYIVVGTGVTDSLGNSLAGSYGSASTSGFTTSAPRAPSVASQYPAKGAISVSLAVKPYVMFSKAMDYTTIDSTTVKLMQNGIAVAANTTLVGTNKAVITPDNQLSGSTVYYVVVTTGIKDTTGMALAAAYGSAATSRFTTAAATPPTILTRYPVDNATAVPFNIQPCVTFSKSMDESTINSTNIQLLDGVTPVTISVNLFNYTKAVITPSVALDFSKTYSLVVGNAVKDSFGNALSASSTGTFTTDSALPPSINSIYPADNSTGVDTGVQPLIVFSEVIDPLTLNANNIKLMKGVSSVRITVAAYSPTIVMVTPIYPLESNTSYSLVITTAVKDTSGNALADTLTTNFTTGAAAAPTVASQYPSNGASAVGIDIKPCVVFSQEMNPATINSGTVLLKKDTATVRANVALYGKYTAIITPQVPLACGTTYYIVVNNGARDMEGNTMAVAYGSATTSRFTTAFSTLIVTSEYPADNSTEAPINTQPCLVFSQKVDAATINTTNIRMLQGANPVTVSVQLFDDNSAIIIPADPLVLNTVYTIQVATAVMDTGGNALGAQFTSTFTTVAANTAPGLTYMYPADNSTGIALDAQICLVFSQEMESATINTTNITLLDGSTLVTVTVAKYGKNTVIIKPSATLTAGTAFTISIGTGVKDINGNAMTATTTSFTTAGS